MEINKSKRKCIYRFRALKPDECASLASLFSNEKDRVVPKKYTVAGARKRNTYKIFSKIVENTISKEMSIPVETLEAIASPAGMSYFQQRSLAHLCAPMHMTIDVERLCLEHLACNSLVEVWPDAYEKILREVRDDWTITLHFAGINERILPHKDAYTVPTFSPYKYLGKTPRYNEFLRAKSSLQDNLFIFSSLHCEIFADARTQLPDLLFRMDVHRDEAYDVKKLHQVLIAKIDKVDDYVEAWYRNITKHYILSSEFQEMYPKTKWKPYLHSLTVMISIQLSNCIRRTMVHMVNCLTSKTAIPLMIISLEYDGDWKVQPPHDEVAQMYCSLIEKLSNIARRFPSAESLHVPGHVKKYLPIYIDTVYIEICHDLIRKHILNAYKPLHDYRDQLIRRFGPVVNRVLLLKQEEASDITFEQGFIQIASFAKMKSKVFDLVTNKFFDLTQVSQNNLIEVLMSYVNILINSALDKLRQMHQWENQDIYDMFNMLKMRALKHPKTTEQLMELTEYMSGVSAELVVSLKNRLCSSIFICTQLIENADLSKEHINLNSRTYSLIFQIDKIIEDSNAMIEHYKVVFEEKLTQKATQLNDDLEEFMPLLLILDDMDDINYCNKYIEHLNFFLIRIREFDERLLWINKEEANFKFPITSYPLLNELKSYVHTFFKLIKLCSHWLTYKSAWLDGKFESLRYSKCQEIISNLMKDLTAMQKDYRNLIRQQTADGVGRRFKGSLDDPDPLNQPAPIKLINKTLASMKEFEPILEIVSVICNDALLQRHWNEMSDHVGFDITPDANMTLRKMLDRGFNEKLGLMKLISDSAIKERDLLHSLLNMQDEWKTVHFQTDKYEDTNLNVLVNLEDILAKLDDHVLKTLTMRSSVFVKPYEKEITNWYEKMIQVNLAIDEWGKVQNQWLYLLPIFNSPNIAAQMPKEQKLFIEIDDVYKKYMDCVGKDPCVMVTAYMPGILKNLRKCLRILDRINDGVVKYLEDKRLYFPRFFFLSNKNMLEILSETEDPVRVQPHISKCFGGIHKLVINDATSISAIVSEECEEVYFKKTINTLSAGGSVEKWLAQVEIQMVDTIKSVMLDSFNDFHKRSIIDWIYSWPSQVCLAVTQILWTANVHACLCNTSVHTLVECLKQLNIELNEIINKLKEFDITTLYQASLKTLIVQYIHNQEILTKLIRNNITKDSDFNWISQLRFYLETECYVKIIKNVVKYGYEYIGNKTRLVITTMTERCYITLLNAFGAHLNGLLIGPTGSGKTTTVKELSKTIATQCIMFNCSRGLDCKAMSKLFKGLASCGAWGCFDELNRIDLKILSVIAQQILCITLAVKAAANAFNFEGTKLNLKTTVFICTTMNLNYVDNVALPDNLKVLFRPVSMMIPDYVTIAEVSLCSFGFTNFKLLSVQLYTVFKLCAEQLSQRNRYNFEIRSIMSTLAKAGLLKRDQPNENENSIILKTIIDMIYSSLSSYELPLFEAIFRDVFPNLKLNQIDNFNLIEMIKNKCLSNNLQATEKFINKTIQTYEMMLVRHGFMLIGETFTGKSSILKVLREVLVELRLTEFDCTGFDYQIINPKAITIKQLFGCYHSLSSEWIDGVVTSCFRKFASNIKPFRNWIIFDGPIDDVWVENLNTVLDDNRSLCLISGEQIQIAKYTSVIFETSELTHTSPAVISRCGIIYIESQLLDWKPLVVSWLENSDPLWAKQHFKFVEIHFDWLLTPCIQYIREYGQEYIFTGNINLTNTTIQIIDILLKDAIEDSKLDVQPEGFKFITAWFQAALIFAIVWGVGGILEENSREKFDVFLKKVIRNENVNYPIPDTINKIEISIPAEGLLFDYFYVFKSRGSWKHIPEILQNSKVNESQNIYDAFIPTIDSIRYSYILNMHIKYGIRTLLVGPSGTGKTFYIKDVLNNLEITKFEHNYMMLTAKITANQCQNLVLSKLNKQKRGNFGPSKGKLGLIFIDDINMPIKEYNSAQPPLELLRQYFDHGFWYDLQDTSVIQLHNVQFLGALRPTESQNGQGVCSRLFRHFSIFSINTFKKDAIEKIYSNKLCIGLKKNGFPNEIMQLAILITEATHDMYNSALKVLRCTPAKIHYLFNLNDFANIVYGCAMMRKEVAGDDKNIFIRLWAHEILRVYYDRVINVEDEKWILNKIKEIVHDVFKENFNDVFERLKHDESDDVRVESLNSIWFGSYFDSDTEVDDRKYEEIFDVEKFKTIAAKFIDEYNSKRDGHRIEIVLFKYALEHLLRILRILSMPNSSALLLGINGSGRQSLARLATQILRYTPFQIKINGQFGLKDWRDYIKEILKEAGGYGRHSAFIFTDEQIFDEALMQDIDSLLNCGEVPNIYTVNERQRILDMVRDAAQGGDRNLEITSLQVFSFFTARCHENLHILLCFNPIELQFRTRLRTYPSLVNRCTIDWFQDWPEEALKLTAEKWLDDIDVLPDVRSAAVDACIYFHEYAKHIADRCYSETKRKTYVTSASFLELIKLYVKLITFKQAELLSSRNRYRGGLEKLEFAEQQLEKMHIHLEEFQPQLIEMTAKAAAMTKEIEMETIEAERASALVKKDEEAANIQAAAAQALKAECEGDLALAIPILEEALSALNTLKPNDITLVKSMKNPPDTVKLVMAAVCVMKGIRPDKILDASTGKKTLDFWPPSKRLLGEMSFLQQLKEFDKDNIKIEIINKIRKEFIPHKDFKPKIVAKASSAAEGLCKWIIAMTRYDAVAREVAPKKIKLEAAEREFEATNAILTAKRELVKNLEDKLARLNAALKQAQEEQRKLQVHVDLCELKLNRAKKLLNGLGGENTRWTQSEKHLQTRYERLPGDILLCSGVIVYMPPYTMQYRLEAVENWKTFIKQISLPLSCDYNFIKILGDDVTIQNWYIASLTRDIFLTENAIISTNTKKVPLFIDPQNQANQWLKRMEKPNGLKLIKLTDPNYFGVLKMCVETGYPCLLENVPETLDLNLYQIFNYYLFHDEEGYKHYLKFSEENIAFNDKFRFYITTKMKNPIYKANLFNKLCVINFTITSYGLENRLLDIIVSREEPNVQKQCEILIKERAKNREALNQTEKLILQTLSETQGDILEDETAIQMLDQSKTFAVDVFQKQEIAIKSGEKIEESRQNFRSVATHSTILFKCISDLSNINPMYQYSLTWFINLYQSSIGTASKSKYLEKRIEFLKDSFTYSLFKNICQSLYEKDRLLFVFLLTCRILIYKNKLSEEELNHFICKNNFKNYVNNFEISWITDEMWKDIYSIAQLPVFEGLIKDIVDYSDSWKTFCDSADDTVQLPQTWKNKLSCFQALLLIKIFKPEKVICLIKQFVIQEMGFDYLLTPQCTISKLFDESNCLCPLIFMLSNGVDPINQIINFTKKKGFWTGFETISLGKGNELLIGKKLHEARKLGKWICLQNCHLAESWLPILEDLLENINEENTHNNFRVWLTSYPLKNFPITILQNGIKMTYETPNNLRENLLKSYFSEPLKEPQFYDSCPGRNSAFNKLLFGIAFFHAIVQVRKTFGSLGWNIPYEFNELDFETSLIQLQTFLQEFEEDVPLEAITYLMRECNYGGRITDKWDRRLIETILKDVVNEKLISDSCYMFVENYSMFCVPKEINEYESVINHIKQFPMIYSPAMFGLHPNAEIIRDMDCSKELCNSMLLLEAEYAENAFVFDESIVAIVEDIKTKLPIKIDIENVDLKYPFNYSNCLNTVLLQEIHALNTNIAVINKSLTNICDVLNGLTIISPVVEQICTSLIIGEIPNDWIKFSHLNANSLSNYINNLLKRYEFFEQWATDGEPFTYWLGGFIHSRAFLSCVKQNHARKSRIAIHRLEFDFEVQTVDKQNYSASSGVYVNGLFINGARWDGENRILAEQLPKVLYDSIPAVWIKPENIDDLCENDKRYDCPVYRTSDRHGIMSTMGYSTNCVMSMLLPTEESINHWVKRSVALICHLD